MAGRAVGPVLIIEDNEDTREVLQLMLSLKGYETVTAGDGLEALSYLRSGGTPAIVVLDLRMPNMDGMAFQRAMRADPRWASIPVVIYSAFPPRDPEGAIGVVRKGATDPDVLLGLIDGVCRRSTH